MRLQQLDSGTINSIGIDHPVGGMSMQSRSRHISDLTLALAVATALISTCPAQEVAFLDLTKVAARVELQRPKATSPVTGEYSGTQETSECFDSTHEAGALNTSLMSLDRTHYQIEDEPTFEVTMENAGSRPIEIPFSPHLADLQPKNRAQKFAYSELHLTLWIASGEQWSANTGGGVILYGSTDHANTRLTLNPGEWVRVIGKGHFTAGEEFLKRAMLEHPVDHVYVEASLYHDETLITPTQSATAGREVCLAQTHGQSLPIQLAIP